VTRRREGVRRRRSVGFPGIADGHVVLGPVRSAMGDRSPRTDHESFPDPETAVARCERLSTARTADPGEVAGRTHRRIRFETIAVI
jgi:hypothetical protein